MTFLQNKRIMSATLAITSALLYSFTMTLAKQLPPEIPTIVVVFIRNVFGLVFLLPIFLSTNRPTIKTKKTKLYIFRALFIVSSMLCTYYAYRNLPLSFATTIGMSGPLFVMVASFIVLKDKISFKKWMIIILGYIGVIIAVKPLSFEMSLGTVSALMSNLLAAGSIIIAKILSRHDSTITILLYTNIGVVILSSMLSLQHWVDLSIFDFVLISILGLLGTIIQYFSITALKYAEPSFVAPFEYTRIVFAFLIGLIFFQEVPDAYNIIGGIIILTSAYMLTLIDKKERDFMKISR